jgi:hypothetical protein
VALGPWHSEKEEKTLQEILTLINNLYTLCTYSTRRTNRTLNVEVDLTTAHADEVLGVEVSGRVYRWLTIETCDVEEVLTYKLKQTDGSYSDSFVAAQGRSIEQHDFVDIVVTNLAQDSGVCSFVLGYWED